MKTVDEILDFVAERIGCIYLHPQPFSYGGTPEGTDLLLHYYHELWAEIHDDRARFCDASVAIHRSEDCNGNSFAGNYERANPNATSLETVKYVFEQWKRISEIMSIPIPFAKLAADFHLS